MVPLEDMARHAQTFGKGVELLVGRVADQVAPPTPPPRPQGVVDQNHVVMLPALEQVVARYDEPHRRYHDRRHLEHVRDRVGWLLSRVAVPDPDAVRLAALFPDAVYDPPSERNEAESAVLAGQVLAGLEPPARVASVQRLVLATAGHLASAPDEGVLIDADLAILASSRRAYVAYVRAVRQEFGHLPDQAWRRGRTEAIGTLLALPRLFTTPPMQAQELPARANLSAELVSLG